MACVRGRRRDRNRDRRGVAAGGRVARVHHARGARRRAARIGAAHRAAWFSDAMASRCSTVPRCSRALDRSATWPAARGARSTATAIRCACCAHCVRAPPQAGATLLTDCRVERIDPLAGGFAVHTPRGAFACERIVLAAGLGNARLAPMVRLVAPVMPNKGQILVTERLPHFLTCRSKPFARPTKGRPDRRLAGGRGVRRRAGHRRDVGDGARAAQVFPVVTRSCASYAPGRRCA